MTERNPAFRTAPVQLNEADEAAAAAEAAAMEDAAEPGALLFKGRSNQQMDNTQTKVKCKLSKLRT